MGEKAFQKTQRFKRNQPKGWLNRTQKVKYILSKWLREKNIQKRLNKLH